MPKTILNLIEVSESVDERWNKNMISLDKRDDILFRQRWYSEEELKQFGREILKIKKTEIAGMDIDKMIAIIGVTKVIMDVHKKINGDDA